MFDNARLKLTACSLLLCFNLAIAEDDTDDQADVWATIESQWIAEENNDKRWVDRLLADEFSGWPTNSPAPRTKASIKMWDRFNDEHGNLVAHELYPLAIVVQGDVAIAHYLYSSAYMSKDDKLERNNGRFTDILVRTGDGWKFIAWHGGDD
ncbi:MAG: nuclear transport factor 2 family protein [Gammaproteobacteria bacterium]|nr:nuclear transport factor 2 family protein [Gammaproteobacteria bacterium]